MLINPSKIICRNIFRTECSLFSLFIQPHVRQKYTVTKRVLELSKASKIEEGKQLIKETNTRKVSTYNMLLKSHAKLFYDSRAHRVEAVKLLKEMQRNGVKPTANTYFILLYGLINKRKLSIEEEKLMEAWFNELSRIQARPNSIRLKVDILLREFIKKGHPKLGDFFMKFPREDTEYWNLVLEGCLNSKKPSKAETVLDHMRMLKISNRTSYHMLITYYLQMQKDLKSASKIFSTMFNDQITADQSIYETFISFYIELRDKDTIATVEKLWQAILLTRKEDDEISVNLVSSLMGFYLKMRALSSAEQLYLDLKSINYSIDKHVVGQMSKLITEFASQHKMKSAMSLYYDLLGAGYNPSNHVLKVLISTSIEDNDEDTANQLLTVTREMKKVPDTIIMSNKGKR
ncbi:hypothetical protein BDB01DRAFT_772719 [Pilobolus umbonatus]|nr:hypothetical protein BDB01DRAFT_772719 [Pilobolus umbonatus]